MMNLLANAGASSEEASHLMLGLGVIFLLSVLGKELMRRWGQAAVLGYLLAGVVLNNLKLVGVPWFSFISEDHNLAIFLLVATVFIMFRPGLETSIEKMRKVGARAALVAVAGAVGSLLLGTLVARYLFPANHSLMHWYVGVMIAATSVGVGAVVLEEMKVKDSETGRTILGAGTIDDVLSLILLAMFAGMIVGMSGGKGFSLIALAFTLVKAVGFLALSAVIGRQLSKYSFNLATRMQSDEVLLLMALAFCFLFAWLAHMAGLAPMIGGFAAGLVLDDVHYRNRALREQVSDLDHLVKPIGEYFTPIFFVVVGSQLNLADLANPEVLKIAGALLAAAIVGKMACGLGMIGHPRVDWRVVAAGMLPRGEVVVAIALQGMNELKINGQPVVPPVLLSAVVIVVVVTSMIAPALMKLFLTKKPMAGLASDRSDMAVGSSAA